MSTSVVDAPPVTETSDGAVWRRFFLEWPDSIPKQGIVVNTLGEQSPFKGYMVNDNMLLLERTNPDPLGSRFIVMSFQYVACVKLIDALKAGPFEEIGFVGTLKG